MRHVDDFIDDPETNVYASWFLNLKRLPAILQFKFVDQIKQYQLYCDYNGERWRVTGASRLGDVWLTKNFDQSSGYQERVSIDQCSNWSPFPDSQQNAEMVPLESIESLMEYINEWGDDTDMQVVKSELGEMILRAKGKYGCSIHDSEQGEEV